MQPGALLASLGTALSPTGRRCLASCGKPLAVLAVLAIGATLFTGAAALLGTRQPAAVFHAAAEGVGSDAARALHAVPVHRPSTQPTTAPDDLIAGLKAPDDLVAGLKEGAFGITFSQSTLEAMAATAAPVTATPGTAIGALVPSVLVDTERPPLRIEIMGFDSEPHQAPAPTRTGQP